jgi:hypothetical protein
MFRVKNKIIKEWDSSQISTIFMKGSADKIKFNKLKTFQKNNFLMTEQFHKNFLMREQFHLIILQIKNLGLKRIWIWNVKVKMKRKKKLKRKNLNRNKVSSEESLDMERRKNRKKKKK